MVKYAVCVFIFDLCSMTSEPIPHLADWYSSFRRALRS
jgi:hypothetical protein